MIRLAFLSGTPEQSQSRAHSDSSQPSEPEFQIIENFGPCSTLLDSSLNRAETRVKRLGTLVELVSEFLVFYLELYYLVDSRNPRSFGWNSRFIE